MSVQFNPKNPIIFKLGKNEHKYTITTKEGYQMDFIGLDTKKVHINISKIVDDMGWDRLESISYYDLTKGNGRIEYLTKTYLQEL